MTNNQSTAQPATRRHRIEGPRNHIIAFILSLVLTIIAFAAVSAGELNKTFVYFILVGMAILQVFVQMAFWMHMKERGHAIPILAILSGVFVCILLVILALYWMWW